MLGILVFGALLLATPGPEQQGLKTNLGEFGEAYQFTAKDGQFEIFNDSDRSLEILVSPSRAHDRVLDAPKSIRPHSSGVVRVLIVPQVETGVHLHGFSVRAAGTDEVAVYGQVRGFVESVLDDNTPLVDFGVIDADAEEVVSKSFKLVSREAPRLTAIRIVEAPSFVDATIADAGHAIALSTKKNLALGIKEGFVKVALSGGKQPEAWIQVRADVHGRVIPFSNPFDFGVARQGQDNEYLIRLDDRKGEAFEIGEPRLEGFKGSVMLRPCTPRRSGCRMFALRVSGDQPTGKLNGQILADLPQQGRTLSINVWGMLFKADTVIKDLVADDTSVSSERRPDANIAKALTEVTTRQPAPIIAPTPPGKGPLLKWNVENERQLYGYIVYRSDDADGPMTRINDSIIQVLSKEDGVPVEYRWRDTTALPGRSYWYQIGTISLIGSRDDLTGRVEKVYGIEPKAD